MEHSSVITPAAPSTFTSPKLGRRSHTTLAWDLGGTAGGLNYSLKDDALSSGAAPLDYAEQVQPYKRRRLASDISFAPEPAYAVAQTTYEATEVPLFPFMVDQPNEMMVQDPAATNGIMQRPSEPDHSASQVWLYMDRLCCAPCLPSWSFYAPLPQDAEPRGKVEAYHGEISSPTSLVSQQYASPQFTEPLDGRYGNSGTQPQLLMQPYPQSIIAQPAQPSMAFQDHFATTVLPIESGNEPVPGACVDQPISPDLHMTMQPAAKQLVYSSLDKREFLYPDGPGSETPQELPIRSSSPSKGRITVVSNVKKPSSHVSKRGPFKDQSLRLQTACTRATGACIECARQRVRCNPQPDDPFGECVNCAKMRISRPSRGPCMRVRLTDVRLSKSGQVEGFEWTRRWKHARKDIKIWASDESKTICISEGFSNTYMLFEVREFVPQKGDKLERSWVHQGSRRSVPVPPFALTKLESAKEAYRRHMRATESGAVNEVVGRSSSLMRRTYEFADAMRSDPRLGQPERELLDITFNLWMVVRCASRSTWIVGPETLGMPQDILDTSPDPGRIPLPPVLGAQLDSVLIHDILQERRRTLLRKLDKAFRRYQHPNWLITYLVSFILLHNAALITAHDAKYARKHGMARRFAREAHVADYHMGGTIILAHFHNCTRNHPFSDQCKDNDLQQLAQMTEEQIYFIRETRVYIKMHEREWARIREEGLYEHDFYFVSQLYQDPWTPFVFSV